ncbi:IS110 family transposase [Williamsia muralis]|uniref:Transposase IS116/IS110/IS902 family protein n=1 Tax=Williamsia marianensis TaxID=85044 RepID=A0A315S0I9_WILMA|nr:transposase IS116/IS110/IS902 family protein [Williamsia marianensis]RKR79851.1 transposase IS116/IS110/IS902 family protein [Williamsia muralis]
MAAWIGIDVGKSHHHACVIDSEGTKLWDQKIANDETKIEALIDRVVTTVEGPVVWAVDLVSPAAALLNTTLLLREQTVVYVPGRTTSVMAPVFRGEAKTDAKDARVIADTARMRRDLSPVVVENDLVAELRQLHAYRTDVMADWVRGINRLRDMLGSIFPALEAAFDYSTRSPLILVSRFCTPAAIRNAGEAGVAKYLRENKAWAKGIPAMAEAAVVAANGQRHRLPGEAGTARLICKLAARLLEIDREIKDLDREIAALFRTHPSARIIESLPGMGPGLGSEFLVITGGNMVAFRDSGKLASYAGLVPVPRDSGRITGNMHRPKRYNRRLRRVFYMAALSSLKTQGPSREFYDRKRAQNMVHTKALIALARRLVDVLWALLRDGREFTVDVPGAATAA